jgi:hypothetical protein
MKHINKTAQTVARKVIGVRLYKTLEKQDDGSILIRGKFTSDNKDEIGDIITRSATEAAIPSYRAWGNIRYMHLPRPVGKVTRIGTEDGLEWNEVEIRVIDPQAVFEVENGLLTALSVGIIINFEDIELSPDEDGGWIIHNYKLAEISLVDHPANYDAKLDLGAMPDAFRTLAREKGLLKALGEYQNLGDPMTRTKKDLTPQVEDTAEVSAMAPEAILDEEVVDKAIEAQEVPDAPAEEVVPAEAEKTLADADMPEAAEVISEDKDLPEEEVTFAEIPAPEKVSSPIPDASEVFLAAASSLEKVVASLEVHLKALAPIAQEVPAEAPSTAERSVETADPADSIRALQEKVASLEAQLADLEKPSARKGVIQAEGVEDETVDGDEKELPQASTLRDAVRNYMLSRSQ